MQPDDDYTAIHVMIEYDFARLPDVTFRIVMAQRRLQSMPFVMDREIYGSAPTDLLLRPLGLFYLSAEEFAPRHSRHQMILYSIVCKVFLVNFHCCCTKSMDL